MARLKELLNIWGNIFICFFFFWEGGYHCSVCRVIIIKLQPTACEFCFAYKVETGRIPWLCSGWRSQNLPSSRHKAKEFTYYTLCLFFVWLKKKNKEANQEFAALDLAPFCLYKHQEWKQQEMAKLALQPVESLLLASHLAATTRSKNFTMPGRLYLATEHYREC